LRPPDLDDIEVSFRSSSDFMTRDESIENACSSGETYRLRWIRTVEECQALNEPGVEVGDARWQQCEKELPLIMRWTCEIHEWDLLAISTKLSAPRGRRPDLAAQRLGQREKKARCLADDGSVRTCVVSGKHNNYRPTTIVVIFHVRRAWKYYFTKAIVPLMLVMLLALFVFFYEEADMDGRLELVVNTFLAAVGLLFVVSTFLPKTSTLTILDYVIMGTLLSIVLIGLSVIFIAHSAGYRDEHLQIPRGFNMAVCASFCAAYYLTLAYLCLNGVRHGNLVADQFSNFAYSDQRMRDEGWKLAFVAYPTADSLREWASKFAPSREAGRPLVHRAGALVPHHGGVRRERCARSPYTPGAVLSAPRALPCPPERFPGRDHCGMGAVWRGAAPGVAHSPVGAQKCTHSPSPFAARPLRHAGCASCSTRGRSPTSRPRR
jgi:hypothetical protein